jgi:hypothetical protein
MEQIDSCYKGKKHANENYAEFTYSGRKIIVQLPQIMISPVFVVHIREAPTILNSYTQAPNKSLLLEQVRI